MLQIRDEYGALALQAMLVRPSVQITLTSKLKDRRPVTRSLSLVDARRLARYLEDVCDKAEAGMCDLEALA